MQSLPKKGTSRIGVPISVPPSSIPKKARETQSCTVVATKEDTIAKATAKHENWYASSPFSYWPNALAHVTLNAIGFESKRRKAGLQWYNKVTGWEKVRYKITISVKR
jgi:hypothetical protein